MDDRIKISNRAKLPTEFGTFWIQSFREYKDDNSEVDHLVVFTQHLSEVPLVRVHSECLTGDVFGSQKCDCGGELEIAMHRIGTHEQGGMLIYLRQEGRGIGLFNKINAYALQDQGYDTIEANRAIGFKDDERDYRIVGDILGHYGIKKIQLLTNNPQKIEALAAYVKVERSSIIVKSNCHNKGYLETKKIRMGHLL